MRHLIFLIFILAYCTILAQGGNRYAAKRVFEFKKSSTIVILDDLVKGQETAYNIALKKAIEGNWRATPVIFKRQSELAKILPIAGFSLLVKSTRNVLNADGYTFQLHADLALLMADKDSINFYGGVDELAAVEIFDTENPVEVTYKLPLLLMAMQQYLDFVAKDGGIDFYDYYAQTNKFFNKQKKTIKNATLYICQEDLPAELTEAEILTVYKKPFKLIKREELPALIAKGEEGFVLHTDMGYKAIWVLRLKDGAVCYKGDMITRGKFTKKDLAKI